MNKADFKEILYDVRFQHWRFTVDWYDEQPYLRVRDPLWPAGMMSRKWLLSTHMTRSEVVQTCLKVVLTALEHEAREAFKYKGVSVFSPHMDIDDLVGLAERTNAGART